ncbi:MAG: bile acid:sodium symporter [Thermodesulfobacteriota bacterium]
MRIQDIELVAVIVLSMGTAVYWPTSGVFFQPFIKYCMMTLLFLSFLRIDFRALSDTSAASLGKLAVLASVKLVVLPVAMFGVAWFVCPDYAVGVLLLSGISTGVVAPFAAGMFRADMVLVLRMVVVTSVAVPFTLPVLVKLLAGGEVSIPIADMGNLLGMVIFIPLAAVVLLRRYSPRIVQVLAARQFSVSLVLFALINLGVFSKYSDFFFGNPQELVRATLCAYLLSGVYYLVGTCLTASGALEQRLAGGVSITIVNNVLVLVFSADSFGPLSPTLAAMYMFPFFTVIVLGNYLLHRKSMDIPDEGRSA